MRWILDCFHDNVGLPWAWSIVGTTIVVRILLVPLTVRQIHSMQSLQAHAPEMKEIQQKYKGDRQKLNEELMKFYRENNINPAASCLPLLAQLPVFIALYFVAQELHRNTSPGSLGWLRIVPNIAEKATAHWSGYVLLAIYAGSRSPRRTSCRTTMDKTQRDIMMVLPLVFITRRRALPDRPRPLLGDDQPVDGRPGPRHAAARAEDAARRLGASGRPEAELAATPAKDERRPTPKPAPPPTATPKPQRQQPRRVKRKKGGARR